MMWRARWSERVVRLERCLFMRCVFQQYARNMLDCASLTGVSKLRLRRFAAAVEPELSVLGRERLRESRVLLTDFWN
jgi:hypothetical protein